MLSQARTTSVDDNCPGDINGIPAPVKNSHDSDKVFYYTYSTITQTLAGAFGILGAYVLFRIQGINRRGVAVMQKMQTREVVALHNLLMDEKVDTRQYNAFKEKRRELLSLEDWEPYGIELNLLISETSKSAHDSEKFKSEARKRVPSLKLLTKNRQLKKRVIDDLKTSVKGTAVTIILSLLLLALTPYLVNTPPWLVYGSLSLTVVLSIVCICLYAHLIIDTFPKRPHT